MGITFAAREIKRTRRAKKEAEQGTILVEVLVAALILLLVFTAVVHEITNLSVLRVQLETRDRAVAYASSLHEQLKAAGCGFDVDYVQPTVDNSGDYIQGGFRGPWGRVQGCALASQANAFETVESQLPANRFDDFFWVDGNNNVKLTADDTGQTKDDGEITPAVAREFCGLYGDSTVGGNSVCNLGDQSFRYVVPTIGNTATIELDVTVNYWFEKIGDTNRSTTCAEISQIGQPGQSSYAPDVIARRISIEWAERGNPRQSIAITKRDNVPVDSVEFATGTRVGMISDGVSAAISLNDTDEPDSSYPFIVRRDRNPDGGCIWFPFIQKRSGGSDDIHFSQFSTQNEFDAYLSTGNIAFPVATNTPQIALQNGQLP